MISGSHLNFVQVAQWRFTTKKKKSVMSFTLHQLNMMKMETQQIYKGDEMNYKKQCGKAHGFNRGMKAKKLFAIIGQ